MHRIPAREIVSGYCPASVQSVSCQDVLAIGDGLASEGDYDKAFDTARYFVDHCSGEPNSGEIFRVLDEVQSHATQFHGAAGQLYFRNYLIAILYVSQSDQWYCNDAMTLVRTSRTTGDTLRFHSGVPIKGTLAHQMIVSSKITVNPFSKSTGVEFDLSQMAYVRVEVYDELGRMVQGDGNGHVYDQGLHIFSIDAQRWLPGTFYVRLSTGNGEVRSLKIVKIE